MANKLETTKEIFSNELKRITNTPENWISFLDTASNNYKYNFSDQVLIFAQRPDAIACADIDTWNKRLHRWIRKGAKGIALLDNNGTGLRHVFDISDTYDKFGRKVEIWEINHIFDNEIIEDLESSFGVLEMKDSLSEAIISSSYNMVEDNFQDYYNELKNSTKDSFLSDLDEDTLSYYFRKILSNSVAYIMLKRCGLNPEDFIETEDFREIVNFNTIGVVSKLGIATSDIAENGLREISETNRELNKKYKNKNYTFDDKTKSNYNEINKSKNNNERREENGNNISQRGRLYDTRYNNRATEQIEHRKIWENEVELHQGTQEGIVDRIVDDRRAKQSLDRNRQTSNGESEPVSNGTSEEKQDRRENETGKSTSLGTKYEQLEESSRGNSVPGTNIQLNLFTTNRTEEEQDEIIQEAEVKENTSAFFISQEEIDSIIKEGGNVEHSKFRIYEHLVNPYNNERASEFLKNEYGQGGYSIENGWVDFNTKGLKIKKGDNEIILNWNKVAERVQKFIEDGTYLTYKEKEEFLDYEEKLKEDFASNYVEFCIDNNIFDWEEPDTDEFDYEENLEAKKTKEEHIKDVLDFLNDKESIQKEIDYLNQVKLAEGGIDEKLDSSLNVFIELFNRYYKEIDKSLYKDLKEERRDIEQAENINNLLKKREENVEPLPVNAVYQPLTNFRINNDNLGVTTPKEKIANNIAAIKVLKRLESEHNLANPTEQEILSKYVGWGGLPDVFDDNKTNYRDEYLELKELLTEEEYNSARASTLTAFYTPPIVIKSIYSAIQNMGFEKGNILEPSCGVGNFLGLIPNELEESKLYGVELDSISGRIAEQLYQKANIQVKGYEKSILQDSFFDIAVGNVPFGSFKVNDRKYDKNNFMIHDYFFAKTLDKVRPGGIIAFITSKGTMDKENPEVRKYIAQRADLIGAIRLPDNTFTDNAGTKVTSDIIFLQKRDNMTDIMPDWVYLDKDENNITMNKYFVDNPEMILGNMEMESTQYGYDSTCKADESTSLEEQLKYAITNIHAEISDYQVEQDIEQDDIETIPADPNVKNFSYTLIDNDVYFRENSIMTKQELPLTNKNRVIKLIQIRDTLRKLMEMELDGYSDDEIKDIQKDLNSLYDSFSKEYGLINSRGNMSAFSQDSSYFLLCSLENLDGEGNFIGKADIFTKRTIRPQKQIDRVDTSNEALIVSLQEKAKVDLNYMSKLTGKAKEQIVEELKGIIYKIPFSNNNENQEFEYQTADEYLSGNVREKYKIAEALSETDESFSVNKESLKQVIPKDISASEIGIKLGSTWIPTDVIKEFIFETLDTPSYRRWDIKVRYSNVTGEWYIENKSADSMNIKANSTYGTHRINAYKIIENTLNLKDVKIYDQVYDEEGNKIRVLNKKETAIATAKQDLLKQTFLDWVWNSPERREKLVRLYNDKFNSIVPRTFNGSNLTFPGMNPEIKLREHQLNAVAHILYGNNVLLAHEVGAGKTFEMVAAAMESKRLGLCNKPMIAVPNHIVEQFANEFLQLYPSANILVTTKKDFETKNRKKFCSRIATGDYDAIIIGHSQFERIPMSIERQSELLEQQIADILASINEEKNNGGGRSYSIKQLEKTRKGLENRLEKLNKQDRKDDVVTFEELGVDKLFVDEAHNYKNLFLYTKMRNVGGIAQTEAQKSSDLFMKCRYLDEITGGKGTVFATGTPVSNTMAELYTMQRYLQYDELKRNELEHFDNWASTFGETITAVELAPEGTSYRAKTRFARFHNLPELMALFKEVADIQTQDTLNLPRPDLESHIISVKPSEMQKEMVLSLADRAEKIRNNQVDSSVDNMLKITNEGRKLALEQRLMNPILQDDENSKVSECSKIVYNIWNDTKSEKSTQLVFCDLSTPKSYMTKEELISEEYQFEDVYNDLKRKLILKGIPEDEIKFIHEADTEVKKKELFNKVRSGEVRILIGSTAKMGAGTNVQDKLIALHHLDCPWKPSDLIQREGRMVRQGNQNKLVHTYTYVTEGTFDSYLFQLVENKQKFISQIMTSKSPSRTMNDVDERALNYGEIKALATGDKRILEKTNLDADVSKLTLLKQNFMSQKYDLQDKIVKYFPETISKQDRRIACMEEDLIKLQEYTRPNSDGFSPMKLNDVEYTEKEQAGKILLAELQNLKGMEETTIGEYRGFSLSISFDSFSKNMKATLRNKYSYTTELGTDAYGNITRLNNLLDNIEKRIPEERDKLDNLQKQLDTAKVEVLKEFSQENELKEKQERLRILNAELNIKEDENEIIDDSPEQEENKPLNRNNDTRF
ncbi:MAG: DEAD/DEAH box helicase family protein [Clostridia bacterium]|nr:DEAD/DEAH box helicase family protein [Clostridia bacterium]